MVINMRQASQRFLPSDEAVLARARFFNLIYASRFGTEFVEFIASVVVFMAARIA